MPSAIPSSGMSTSRGRFELPVLAPLDSLTAGTNIPPPPDSPIEETPLAPLSKAEPEIVSATTEDAAVNGHSVNGNGSTEYSGRGRTNGSAPTSPISPTRPSSIRRFLSRKSLHNSYSNGMNNNSSQENLSLGVVRPESPSAFSTVSKAGSKRRSSSWFRRFVSGGYGDESEPKRTSIVYEEKESIVLKGPPPPTLPELDQLKAKVDRDDAGSLGGEDMFKNIK